MTPLPIAHRAPRDADRCVALAAAGARMFELDIQLRAGAVVVSHYLPLSGWLAALPVERDNWRFRIGPGHDRSLDDALAVLPPESLVLLDPKHHPGVSAEALLAAALAQVARSDPARFAVSTSRPALLEGYRAGGVRTWRSVGDRAELEAVLAGGRLAEDGVSVRHTLLDAETVDDLHAITGIIVAWTVNRVRRALRLVDLGVDGITTDSARVLAAVSAR